jgi:membrane-associated phospholipid phosphatase
MDTASSRLKLLWMAGCSTLFCVVYGMCNWITGLRAPLHSWYYHWESHIPFMPAMIIPYWSLDAFFGASFFLTRSLTELMTLGKRIGLAITVAGVCFLLLPLHTAFPRPAVSGALGGLFRLLYSFDEPYNLFPSLHITLCTIIGLTWTRHSHGMARYLLQMWFCLIGFSAVLTYQHHVVDVAGGLSLAALCFYVFPESEPTLGYSKNHRAAFYYGCGAAGALGLALVVPTLRIFFLWFATAMGLMVLAYTGVGPGMFRKEAGRVPFATRILLGPCLVGQYISLLYYSRRCRACDQVVPGIFIGRRLTEPQAAATVRAGVTAVLDLTAEFSEPPSFRKVVYRNVPVLDLTAPTLAQLADAAGFIEENAKDGKVYVHCKLGYSRSAAAVGAYLLQSRQAHNAEEALTLMRRARPSLLLRPECHSALRLYESAIAPNTFSGAAV